MSWFDIFKNNKLDRMRTKLTYDDDMFIFWDDEPSIPKNEFHAAKALLYVIQLEEGEAKAKSKLAYLLDSGYLPYDYVYDKYDSGEYTARPEKLPTGEKIRWNEIE